MNTRRIAIMAIAALALAACVSAQTVTAAAVPKVVMPSAASHITLAHASIAPAAPAPLPDDQQAPPPPPVPPAPPAPPSGQKVMGGVVGSAPMPAQTPKVQIRMPRGQAVNIKVELTIVDQIGAKPPVRKTVMATIADGYDSRIRSQVIVWVKSGPSSSQAAAPLSVDISPLIEGNKIRVDLGLEYTLPDPPPSEGERAGNTQVTERLSVLLESGVSAIVSQAMDPLTDRKVTVEVKATILK